MVVFNLCDGIEVDGYPGIQTVRALEKSGLAFTGADTAFYELTTPKTLLKQRLIERGVSTSPFVAIKDPGADGVRARRPASVPADHQARCVGGELRHLHQVRGAG